MVDSVRIPSVFDHRRELYGVRPEEFTAARNALAKQLKADGRKDEAAVVAKLRRPTLGAWALNQVAHAQPDLVAAALAAGAQLRAATEATVAGKAGALREASAGERAAATAVVKAAAAHLGDKAGGQQQALLATLRMAALDEAVADQLRRGVLDADHAQGGFGVGVDGEVAPLAASPPTAKEKRAPAARALRSTKAPKASAKAEPEVDERTVERQRAEKAAAQEAARLRKRALAERMRTADRRAREATRLAKEADDAEAEARVARAAADAAQTAADAAHAALRELKAD